MAAAFDEKYNSRQLKRGSSPSFTIAYIVVEEPSEYDATELVLAGIDPTAEIDGVEYPITEISAEALADQIWEVTVTYGQGTTAGSETPELSISGTTTGGRAKITQSLGTVSYAPGGGTAPDFAGLIGVTKTSIEGVEIPIPALTFNVKIRQAATWAYIKSLAALTGKVNDATFLDEFAAGEVRYDGADFDQQQVGEEVDFVHHFTVEQNVTGLTVGGGTITGIAKGGHQYLWVRSEEEEDGTANALVQRPIAAYVETVHEAADFPSVLGFGS